MIIPGAWWGEPSRSEMALVYPIFGDSEMREVQQADSKPIAHVRETGEGGYLTHDLAEHLNQVASLSAEFAAPFGGDEWARLAGLWHDLGKYRARFQNYIRHASGYDRENAHIEGQSGKSPHSTAGAIHACNQLGKPGRVLAYLIAGHHAGLHDWHDGLAVRIESDAAKQEWDETVLVSPPQEILSAGGGTLGLAEVPGRPREGDLNPHGFALWVRMLFSCLVDADFLDTESFMNSSHRDQRGGYPDMGALLVRFNRYMEHLTSAIDTEGTVSQVNRLRADILNQCRHRASDKPGLFSLTVPTGGGKTLSSLAFALEHANKHSLDRVIYVIPYTSIIEQTADVFRSIFNGLYPEPVIEHHSNAEMDAGAETLKSRLACENWDAPVIVTTNVQFFESLFAARTSRCRKLHNLANSVIVLDEAQMLPSQFLQPIIDVLNLLTRHYGVSVVLSTATQPALSTCEYLNLQLRGLDNVRELMTSGPFVTDPNDLYRVLKRVNVLLPEDWRVPVSWEYLASKLIEHQTVLCIVNRRRDAQLLYKLMPQDTLHLSALMCGAHRSDVIRVIKQKLKSGEPLRVISTSLIDCGVDLDFPIVFRALTGLDSIAQSAGRCNREGLLPEPGKVIVFVPPVAQLPDMVKRGIEATISTLYGSGADPLDRVLFNTYFEHYYAACELDEFGIGNDLKVDPYQLAVKFRSAAAKFRLIRDEDNVCVVVRYQGPDGSDATVNSLLGKLRRDGPERWLFRKLQRYTVNVPRQKVELWEKSGQVEQWQPGWFVQVCNTGYSNELGLIMDDETMMRSQVLIG